MANEGIDWDYWVFKIIIPIAMCIFAGLTVYLGLQKRKVDMSKIIPRFKLSYIRTDLEGLRKEIGTTFSKEQYMELRKYRKKKGNDVKFIQDRLIFHSYLNKPPANIKWECFYLTKDNKAKYDSHMSIKSSKYLDDPYFFWPGLALHNEDILSDNVKEIFFRIYYTDPESCYKFKVCHVFKRVREAEWEPISSDFHKNWYGRCKLKNWIEKWKRLGGKKRGKQK